MPISLGSVDLEYKSLPLTLNVDGSCNVTLRRGFFNDDGIFEVVSQENFYASPEETSAILDIAGNPNLTRRVDLSLAIYQFCVNKGAKQGIIS